MVTANVGILHPLSPSKDQTTSYAAVTARQHDAASLPERVIQGEVPFTPVRNGALCLNTVLTHSANRGRCHHPADCNSMQPARNLTYGSVSRAGVWIHSPLSSRFSQSLQDCS